MESVHSKFQTTCTKIVMSYKPMLKMRISGEIKFGTQDSLSQQ